VVLPALPRVDARLVLALPVLDEHPPGDLSLDPQTNDVG
jgi:hypothetical protein